MGDVGLLRPFWDVGGQVVGPCRGHVGPWAMLGQHVGKVERPQNTEKYRVFRNRHIAPKGRWQGPLSSPSGKVLRPLAKPMAG